MKFIERKRNIYYCRNFKVSNNQDMPAYTFWCPECKKMIEKESDMYTLLPEYKEKFRNSNSDVIYNCACNSPELFVCGENGRPKVICPHCGYDMSFLQNYHSNGDDKEKTFFLTRCRCWTQENAELVCYNVFVGKDNITVSGFFMAYLPIPEYEVIKPCKINTRIVFNTKTGMTYSFRSVDFHTKKSVFDVYENKIINATYTDGCAHTLAKKTLENPQVFRDVANALAEAHHVSISEDEIQEMLNNSRIPILSLSLFNRFPSFNNAFRKNVSKQIVGCKYDRNGFRRNARKLLKFKDMQEDPSLFVKYMKKNKIPDIKAIRRRLIKNPYLITSLDTLEKLGFKDINVILGIIDDNENLVIDLSHCTDDNYYYRNRWMSIIEFFTFLIDMKGEPVVRKNVFGDKSISVGIIEDTAMMFHRFKEAGILKKQYFKGSVKDIHDRLSADYRKVQTRKEEILYSDFEKELNDNIDGYEFHLAFDTHQLIDIGTNMGICVGSYGRRAVSKQCIIVAITEGSKYVGCIELSLAKNNKTEEQYFEMAQAKAKFNNLLQENKAIALRKWVQKHRIRTEYCRDYTHIKNDQISFNDNEIYQGDHNYANYGFYGNEQDFMRNVAEAQAGFMEIPDDFEEDPLPFE